MPTVGIKRDVLFKYMGCTYSDEEFDELCFEYGLELDEVTSERAIISKEQGELKASQASDEVIYKIDVPANRYDLLCVEGLATSLLIFKEKMKIPYYKPIKSIEPERLNIKEPTSQVREFAVASVLRDVTFTKESYASFIDLQDKLHQNICRKRTLVSIGTHDLDTVSGPFTYTALSPDQIRFRALNQTTEMSAIQLFQLYKNDNHLKHFLHIIEDKPLYPVIHDKNGIIMSLPPIINGDHSKITLDTKNIFIEVTATDHQKAQIVLDILTSCFSCYCKDKYSIEIVEVKTPDDKIHEYPKLPYREEVIQTKWANTVVGTRLTTKEISKFLTKMCIKSDVNRDDRVRCIIPPTRPDVIHACDIYEDLAIAYGYNNIHEKSLGCFTIASQQALNRLSDKLRADVAMAGFTEGLNFSLCSKDDVSSKINQENGTAEAIHISNPKTLDFQIARTTLLPGLLKTIAANKNMPLPLKLFELGDIVVKDTKTAVGSRNERQFCAVYCHKTPGFEIVHGLLDRIMQLLQVKSTHHTKTGYFVRQCNNGTFFAGRSSEIVFTDYVIGQMGVVHPQVLSNFDITSPCSALVLNIDIFV